MEKNTWSKNVVYIDDEGKIHQHENSVYFDSHVLPLLTSPYSKYSVLNDNKFWHSKRFELAVDDRWIKPRVNCQFSEGMFLELYDYR